MAAFHQVFRLTYELRAQTWKMTVDRRTVDVEVRHQGHGYQRGTFFTSSMKVPPILQVCQEGRNCGRYEKAFSKIATPGKGLR
ncbi:hypothetical protein BKA66DRAFT_170255 [Pyrenochaeta sp. MPI-SDFR-AT-0127]|nr:hypothetical protein BKA66DRAFT_170255 [Pyrenochaeta sp. MPI-SDFR-AT-0127]